MQLSLSKKSFTLIEMLIVIVIIGILAAALVPRLQDVQGRARDTKRKADLSQTHNALLIYQADFGKFPVPHSDAINCGTISNSGTVSCHARSTHVLSNGARISGMNNYMTSMPVDPINIGHTNGNRGPWYETTFSYAYTSPYGLWDRFSIWTKLENSNDPDRCHVTPYVVYTQTNPENETCLTISPPFSSSNVTTESLRQSYVRSYP